jgi:hypothetical protein
MSPKVRIAPTTPIPSEELEKEAQNAGIESDKGTRADGDVHLPASENERAEDPGGKSDHVGRHATMLPPD